MSFHEKIIIVCGAASGMGAATVRLLRAQRATVIAADRDAARLEEICRETGARPYELDVRDSYDCDILVEETHARLQRLDGLVNFAGVIKRTGILDCTDEEFDYVMSVNAAGCFYLCRAAARVMKPQGFGSIVNISSIWSDIGAAGVLAYCASKGAVSQITRSAALDLAGSGVRVNEIRPGETNTPMLASERGYALSDEEIQQKLKEIAAGIPEQRLAEPREIAAAALFLLSDASSYMQGGSITVDGGYSAC